MKFTISEWLKMDAGRQRHKPHTTNSIGLVAEYLITGVKDLEEPTLGEYSSCQDLRPTLRFLPVLFSIPKL